jgi:hypothetical protein
MCFLFCLRWAMSRLLQLLHTSCTLHATRFLLHKSILFLPHKYVFLVYTNKLLQTCCMLHAISVYAKDTQTHTHTHTHIKAFRPP